MEMHFSRKRQRFLVNQGYSYKVITELEGFHDEEGILYRNKQEQLRLLAQVMQAGDQDEDEGIPSDSPFAMKTHKRIGNAASLSGADTGDMYAEMRRSVKSDMNRHPLFKRFKAIGK
ncbi:DNA excision repair protein haywire-like [Tropilaelaps mercedesae]|uniref:DNA excision repair protein haywire-like n=1 Tax=Tropilaelaps mercedesae TaxID=418985 RepID=A0A1V9X8Q8_9ACAR|nr:DNA excision repair protein haywire-like [Tropilaelaps mercedesae]